uniref:Uncharacterized protein n=1 Tax=Rhizophora mucronata TaxID=61149 RepID=A0A2P2P972_RHIMU
MDHYKGILSPALASRWLLFWV